MNVLTLRIWKGAVKYNEKKIVSVRFLVETNIYEV